MAIDPNILLKAEPIDIGGAIQAGDKANMDHLAAQQARTDMAETQQDQALLKDYAQLPEADLFTSEGLKKAQDHLKGRVSPKTYIQLADRYGKMQQAELASKAHIAKLSELQLQTEKDDNEFVVQNFEEVYKEKDPAKKQELLNAAFDRVASMKRADGTPRILPQQIEQLKKFPLPMIDSLYAGSDFKSKQIDRLHKEAQTRKLDADAKLAEMGGKATMHIDTTDNAPVRVFQTGIAQKQDPQTGEWNTVPMPATLRSADVKQGGAAEKTKLAAERIDFTKNPPTPEEEQIARNIAITGKVPAMGQNAGDRYRLITLASKMAVESGGSDLADNNTYKLAASGSKKLSDMWSIIHPAEETVKGNLELMKPLINKVDSTGVPTLERWIRAGKRAVQGDADVTQLNSLIVSTQADIGKVLSAATGAAGIPVAAMVEAKKYMDSDLTKSQFDALYDIVPREMEVRTKSMSDQISNYTKQIADLSRVRRPTVTPAEQKDRDTDTTKIMREELVKARSRYRTETDSANKARIDADIKALEREIKSKGGKLDEEGSQSNPIILTSREAQTDLLQEGKYYSLQGYPYVQQYRGGKFIAVSPAEPAGAVPASRKEELNKKYGL